jgi:hypothetical protein
MELRKTRSGRIKTIYSIVMDDGRCPAEDFIQEIEVNNKASFKALTNLLIRHADHGQIWDPQKSKRITRSGIFEFKTMQGDRLLYFYDLGNKTILTHGFHKGRRAQQEYRRAEQIKERYLREAECGRTQ